MQSPEIEQVFLWVEREPDAGSFFGLVGGLPREGEESDALWRSARVQRLVNYASIMRMIWRTRSLDSE